MSSQNAEQVSKWAIYTVKPMDTFVHNNVALLGDAVSISWLIPVCITNTSGPCDDSLPRDWSKSSNRGKNGIANWFLTSPD